MKILAVASAGGHWIQLLRLIPAFETHKVTFVSTKESFAETVKGYEFYSVPDASRDSVIKVASMGMAVMKIVYQIRPDVIITTGAAPGLMSIIAGRFLGAKTIWVDSIANVEKISLSGKIAQKFASRIYTQWPDLEDNQVLYRGSIL